LTWHFDDLDASKQISRSACFIFGWTATGIVSTTDEEARFAAAGALVGGHLDRGFPGGLSALVGWTRPVCHPVISWPTVEWKNVMAEARSVGAPLHLYPGRRRLPWRLAWKAIARLHAGAAPRARGGR
jgi:hypothetical protein